MVMAWKNVRLTTPVGMSLTSAELNGNLWTRQRAMLLFAVLLDGTASIYVTEKTQDLRGVCATSSEIRLGS
jgi:hypothetical protein